MSCTVRRLPPSLRRLSFEPVVESSTFVRMGSRGLPAPLDSGRIIMARYARTALYDALAGAGLPPTGNVLLPAFCCGVLAAPFHEIGWQIRYYRQDDDLNPRLSSIRAVADKETRAVVVIDYFGFPPAHELTAEFCRDRNLVFIEDNAHGFLSASGTRSLGTFGDIGIVSFRKTIAVPGGGAVLLNRSDLWTGAEVTISRSLKREAMFAARNGLQAIERATCTRFVRRVRQHVNPQRAAAETVDREERSLEDCRGSVQALSLALLRRIDPDLERATRRAGFENWRAAFEDRLVTGLHPLFSSLPDGVAPFAFPVVAADWRQAAAALTRAGVDVMAWPAAPSDSPGWSVAERLLLLPVR